MPRMSRPRVLSGMQPTADSLHLGNYLGALRQWVSLQDQFETFYFVADLHAITVEQDPATLRRRTRVTAAQFLAAGVDLDRSTLFVQSHVPEHAQLQWVLGCLTGHGEASRMTQFKDKAARGGADRASVGLFTYPILQAADILLYQAERVPVGEDQRQHIELTRDLAQRFNRRFGETFVVPEPHIMRETAKIYDLQNVDKQMSSSVGGPGVVWLSDDAASIEKKIKSAVTDSGSEVKRGDGKEGIANLIEILAVARGTSEDEIEREFEGSGYGNFKSAVAEAVVDLLAPVRERYEELRSDEAALEQTLSAGAEKARAMASETLGEVRRAMGVGPA